MTFPEPKEHRLRRAVYMADVMAQNASWKTGERRRAELEQAEKELSDYLLTRAEPQVNTE